MSAGQSPLYFYVHVPKCAGRTVENHLKEHLKSQFIQAHWVSKYFRHFRGQYHNFYYDPKRARDVRAFSGHQLARSISRYFPDRPLRELVLLRDPLSYLISYYNFRRTRYARENRAIMSFSHWYRTRPLNPISTFLLTYYFEISPRRQITMSPREKLAFLDEQLSRFWYVNCYRQCDAMVALLSDELGIPQQARPYNVNDNKHTHESDLSQSLIAQIAEQNAVDYALYQRWRGVGLVGGHQPQPLQLDVNARWPQIQRSMIRPLYYARSAVMQKIGTAE